MGAHYQFRAYIGPAYEPAPSAFLYDWTQITALGLDVTAASTTLASTLADGATSMALASGANMRPTGGVWVGPGGGGQAWEYISYSGKSSNTLTGLRREPAAVREHNGVHTAGAVVRQWWEIAGDNGRLVLSELLDDNLSAITWSAELSGLLAPQAALRRNHLIVVQAKAGAGAWTNLLIGFIRQPRIRDDGRRLAAWQFQIGCLAAVVDGYRNRSIRVGELDLAKAASASSDQPLAMAHKEYGSGEFTAAEPDFAAGSAIDGDPETLWIAERYRGPAPSLVYPSNSYDIYEGRFVSGMRIRRWPGEGKGYRWLEFLAPNSQMPNSINNGLLACKTAAAAVSINFDGLDTSPGDLLVFAENLALFQEANPLANPLAVFEIGSGFFDALDPAGDAVAVYVGGWYPTVAYGTGGTPKAPGNLTGRSWSGPTIAAPGVGQIIRYDYVAGAANSAAYFKTDAVDMVGYRTGGEDPWVQVTLPVLGLALRDDITSSSPAAGARLYLRKGESDSSDGLSAAGTLQVGLEQIAYSARYADSVLVAVRGANGTAPAAHVMGDAVRVLDTDGSATLGQLVTSITVKRSRAPYIESFKIRISNFDRARTPPDDNHDEDYTIVAQPTGNAAAAYTVVLSPARRVTNVLVEIDHMAGSGPARPRINDIVVLADAAAFDATLVMAAQDAANVVAKTLTNAGLPAAAVVTTAGAGVIDDVQTAEGEGAFAVAADLAARTDVLINCERAGWVAIGPNPLTHTALTAGATWTEINAAAVEFVQAAAAAVGQVRLPYRLPDGATGRTDYPTVAAFGAELVLEIDEARYATAGAAQDAARRLFIRRRYPAQLVVQCADEQPTLRPGAVVRVTWGLGAAGAATGMQLLSRLGIVMAADHEIVRGMWRTVLTVAQVDREWEG